MRVTSIVGFGCYRYRYDSGHEGTAALVGFSPRKAHLVVYLVGGVQDRLSKAPCASSARARSAKGACTSSVSTTSIMTCSRHRSSAQSAYIAVPTTEPAPALDLRDRPAATPPCLVARAGRKTQVARHLLCVRHEHLTARRRSLHRAIARISRTIASIFWGAPDRAIGTATKRNLATRRC